MSTRLFDVLAETFGEPEFKCPTCRCPNMIRKSRVLYDSRFGEIASSEGQPITYTIPNTTTTYVLYTKSWWECTNCKTNIMRNE